MGNKTKYNILYEVLELYGFLKQYLLLALHRGFSAYCLAYVPDRYGIKRQTWGCKAPGFGWASFNIDTFVPYV